MIWEIGRTPIFDQWLEKLRDRTARAIISRRIDRVAEGNLGDVKSLGDGISEIRVDHGPGYRVYFTRRGNVLIVLLCGGDKGSQTRDVTRARFLAAEI